MNDSKKKASSVINSVSKQGQVTLNDVENIDDSVLKAFTGHNITEGIYE